MLFLKYVLIEYISYSSQTILIKEKDLSSQIGRTDSNNEANSYIIRQPAAEGTNTEIATKTTILNLMVLKFLKVSVFVMKSPEHDYL